MSKEILVIFQKSLSFIVDEGKLVTPSGPDDLTFFKFCGIHICTQVGDKVVGFDQVDG